MPCYIFSTAVKRLKGKQDNDNVLHTPVARLDGSICATADEVAKRWTEHYESTLNQSAANLQVLRAKRPRSIRHSGHVHR